MSAKKKPVTRKCPFCGAAFETTRSRVTCNDPRCERAYRRELHRKRIALRGETYHTYSRKPMSRETFAKFMAPVSIPIGDDEPLSNYIPTSR